MSNPSVNESAKPAEVRIAERTEVLREIANDLQRREFSSDKIILHDRRIVRLTRAYFILNECYKDWRILTGHYTETPKIAALQAMAIATFQPFMPEDPSNVVTFRQARCNEIYALACASGVLGTEIAEKRENFYLRLLDVVAEARSETLEPYFVDLRAGITDRPISDYRRPIHDKDKLIINALITIFELISGKFD